MTTERIPAIETAYRGVQFRSRLEAKWAAFFDLCSWPWQYEPLDLNGYIPDFVLPFKCGPVLVEVKPEIYRKALQPHTQKIEQSGWKHESLIVGADIFADDMWDAGAAIGILDERGGDCGNPKEDAHWWGGAIFEKCLGCGGYSFFHGEATYRCRSGGCYEGDHFIDPAEHETVRRLFAAASHEARWVP